MARHFLVAGAQRCGTTHLRELLAAHPRIAMAEPMRPEPKVFLSDEVLGRDLAWYDATFFGHAAPEDLRGEKSTSYLDHPEAARRARTFLGDVPVVVQLRDPVARAVSHWAFSTDNGLEDLPLEDALRADLAGGREWDRARTSTSPYAYLRRGDYARDLVPWFAELGDLVRVQFLEEVDAARVRALYAWLGVDADFVPDGLDERVNASVQPAPDLSADLLAELRAHFADADERLAALLGRPLPWPEPEGA